MQIESNFEVALVCRTTRIGRVHVGEVLCKSEKAGRILNSKESEAVQLDKSAVNDR